VSARRLVDLPIDLAPVSGQSGCPTAARACHRLTDDIVFRNTPRI
jgi:hypothetical protein